MNDKVLSMIREKAVNFPKCSQRVAGVVLDQPGKVLVMSIVDVATLADVSEPTVLRFCRRLGFEGFKEFKQALADDGNESGSQSIFSASDDSGILAQLGQPMVRDFNRAIAEIDPINFDEAVDVIKNATEIEVWVNASYEAFIYGACGMLFDAGKHLSILKEPNQCKMLSGGYDKNSVVIVIPPSNGDISEMVKSAERVVSTGAVVITIAPATSALTSVCTLPISIPYFGERESDNMITKFSQLFVLNTLSLGVSGQSK